MSRSYRKVGAYAYCGGTDKKDRTLYHREERAKVRDLLKAQEKLGTDVGDLRAYHNYIFRNHPISEKDVERVMHTPHGFNFCMIGVTAY